MTDVLAERLQAILDWADLALANPDEFNAHGVKNLDGPIFDEARLALASRSAIVEEPTPGEATCECCGGPALTWFAPNPLWNLVQGGPDATDDPGGMLCPNCFIRKAEAAGIIPTAWVLDRENLAFPQPHTGRAGVTDEMINAALNEKYGEVSIWSQLRVGVRSPFEIMRAALNAALTVEPAHPDDAAVDRFAAAMKAKLAKKRAEGRGGWERKDECTAEFLSELLRGHVKKGDPLDVGNLAMMLHQRGERILTVEPEAGEVTK